MRSKIVLFLFAGLVVLALCSNSGGYGANRTGATGSSGCGSCHGSTSSIGTTVELDSAGIPVTSYVPGMSYRIKIKAVNNTGLSLPAFGFELCAVRLTNAGSGSATQAGTWGTLPPGTQTISSPAVISHSQRLSPISGTGANGTVYADSILWTAPASGTGSVKIYGLINAVNQNGNSDIGDQYQLATPVTISEVTISLMASVHIAQTAGTNPACAGGSVTFTATPTNGGSNPTYQWQLNGVSIPGANTASYTGSGLPVGSASVTCVMTSNLAGVTGSPATSNSITLTVNPTVTPTDSITSSTTAICSGSPVTFTAHPVNGGSTPSYQWKVNGNNAGTNSATFTTSSLTNGQAVTCDMTSNAACASPATVSSNPITITVNPSVAPADTISTLTNTICSGASVTFTVAPTNGGSTPAYQWKVNGGNVGTNSTTYTTNTLTNGAVVTCVMTSNAPCPSPTQSTSNAITMTVNTLSAPSITIHNNSAQCIGTPDTFSAAITNGGVSPSFQWKVNGSNAGTNSSSFISSTFAAGDVVTCVLTSSSACASPTTATSNSVTVVFGNGGTPSVTIATPATSICAGASATFTATPTLGGSAPSYQWMLNGNNVGAGVNTYASSTLATGDVISCILTSNAACISSTTDTSNIITMTVQPVVTPSISISTTDSVICQGATAVFTATGNNGGTSPLYQWRINGGVQSTGTTFSYSNFNNGDLVSCSLTSNAACAAPTQVTSRSIMMTIQAGSGATLTPHGALVICNGDSLLLTAGGGTTYAWSNGASSSTIYVYQSGIYTVTASGGAGCSSTAPALTLTVHVPSVPTISQSGNTLSASLGSGYSWLMNGNVLPADTGRNIHITQSGDYAVMVKDASGCFGTSAVTHFVYSGIAAVGSDMGLLVYPMPNQGSFVIEASHTEAAEVSLCNIYGQVVYHHIMTDDRLEIKDLTIAPGMYILIVSADGTNQTIKMQITKD